MSQWGEQDPIWPDLKLWNVVFDLNLFNGLKKRQAGLSLSLSLLVLIIWTKKSKNQTKLPQKNTCRRVQPPPPPKRRWGGCRRFVFYFLLSSLVLCCNLPGFACNFPLAGSIKYTSIYLSIYFDVHVNLRKIFRHDSRSWVVIQKVRVWLHMTSSSTSASGVQQNTAFLKLMSLDVKCVCVCVCVVFQIHAPPPPLLRVSWGRSEPTQRRFKRGGA